MTNAKEPGKARKHHFLPECYLEGWADPNRRLIEYAVRTHGKVFPRWTSPAGTGYEHDLYAFPALGDRSDALEKRLMAMIDSSAASALVSMRKGEALDPKGRHAFAALLATFLIRTPASIHALKAAMEEWRGKDRPETQAIYERFIWAPGMPLRASEQFAATDTREDAEAWLADTFAALFTHEGIVKFNEGMKWRVLTLPEGAPPLVTGDHPIVSTDGLDRKDSYLLVPIAPRRLFLATHSGIFANQFIRRFGLVELARYVNRLIVARARRFVYSIDRSQDDLIIGTMGTKPVQSVGEKVAMKDPRDSHRPPGYGPGDAIADYVEFVRGEVAAGRS